MKKTSDGKKYIKAAIVVLSVVFIMSLALFLINIWEDRQGFYPEYEIAAETLRYGGQEYELSDNISTLLVLGLDKFEGDSSADSYNNDKQSDFLMIFIFDNDAKECSAIHINRDTMAKINVLGVAGNKVGTVNRQIALAHTYGNGRDVSCRNAAEAVSSLLMGIKVDHYISLNMDSVAIVNDLVGGVEVTVLDDFTGIDDTLVKGKNVTLKGSQALVYVRTRYGLEDSSNSTRMKRQQQYINALHDKFYDCMENDEEFIIEATLKLSDHIVSDRSVTQLQELSRKFSEYEFLGIEQPEGRYDIVNDLVEFYPDKKSIERIVIEKFYELKK
ncbi:MAG: LCP family protein [Clostridia bacterium]|nr:LCP family protein [Clostridia bacterium]